MKLKLFAVAAVVVEKDLEIPCLGVVRATVKSVVEPFGYREEIRPSLHDLPTRFQSQLAHQRKQPGQKFGDTAAHSGRIHHLNAGALQRLGERAQFFYLRRSQQGNVLVQGS